MGASEKQVGYSEGKRYFIFLHQKKKKKFVNVSFLFISLWEVFSTPDCLGASWAQSTTPQSSPSAMSAPKASADLRKMTKEEMRALEGEKDVDSLEEVEKKDAVADKKEMASTKCTVDIASLRRSYDRLFALDNQIFEAGLVSDSILTRIIANKEFAGECFNDALL